MCIRDRFWENRNDYAYKHIILKDVFPQNSNFLILKGYFEIEGKNGILLQVFTNEPSPKKGDIIRQLHCYVKPIRASGNENDYYILQKTK